VPSIGPISRQRLFRYLRQLGFDGPYSGGNHQYMVRDDVTVWIPNPHRGDIGGELLARVLRQAGISRNEWEAL